MTGSVLESSSSNDTAQSEVPELFLDSTIHQPVARRSSRRSSITSAIRERFAGGDDTGSDNYDNYSEKNIYPDLDDEQIMIKRTQSRAAIINTLEERAILEQHLESTDGEKGIQRTKSYYDGAQREEELPTENDGVEFQEIDPELVTWEGDDDPQNPRNWKQGRKWRSTAIVSAYTLLSPFASTMLAPAMPAISQDFGVTNSTISALAVSIYILAWAIFPPFVAPLSEMYGRKRVLDISVWILFAFNLGCALSQNMHQLIIFRLFAGIGGCAPICIGAGVLGDLFNNNDIALAMSLYSLGPSMGPCVSSLMSGYIVQYAGWRWCFWVLLILNGCVGVVGNLLIEETYPPTLLARKAAKMRKSTGNQALHSLYEIANGETTFDRFWVNITRPLTLLVTHPMVFGLGLFMAIIYGCLYILITCFPRVWREVYGFQSGTVGLMYVSLLIGYALGTYFTQKVANNIYKKLVAKNNGVHKPEYRLPLLLESGVTCATGLFWFGWGAQKKMHYVFTDVGAGIFAFGVIAMFFTIQNYLVQMNPRFAASAVAAASIFRSFLGFAFPLFANNIFDNVGYGWGCSIFGFIAIATGIPFPLFVIYRGEKLRLWANKRQDASQAKRDAKNLARLKAKQEKEASAYDSIQKSGSVSS